MALTNEQKISQGFIDELTVIADQYAAGSQLSPDERGAARSLTAVVKRLADMAPILEARGVEDRDIISVSTTLSLWAASIAPEAEVTWDRETVTAKLNALAAFRTLGYVTDKQEQQVVDIKSKLSFKATTGERGERNPQEAIEGRPEYVEIVDADGNVFSKQRGNVASSANNLKTRVSLFVKSATGNALPSEVGKEMLAAIKQVTEQGKSEATYGGFTFRVATA